MRRRGEEREKMSGEKIFANTHTCYTDAVSQFLRMRQTIIVCSRVDNDPQSHRRIVYRCYGVVPLKKYRFAKNRGPSTD